jgi:hypothetical protein
MAETIEVNLSTTLKDDRPQDIFALQRTAMQPLRLTYFIPPLRILRDLLDSLQHWHHLLYAFRFSAMLCNTEGVVKSLAKYGVSELATSGKDAKEITPGERAFIGEALTILNSEEKNGYSFLLAQATITAYSYLEAAIKSLVVGHFSNQEQLTENEALKAVQVPFAAFRTWSEEEQYEYVFQQYERVVGAGLKGGIKRFECLLEPIGLSGPRGEAVDEGIYELAQVRQLLLHKNGVVDKKFAEACPWFSSQLGRKLAITPEMFDNYNHAVMEYIATLIKRIEEKAAMIKESRTMDGTAA